MVTLQEYLIAEATEYEFKTSVEVDKPRSWLKTVSAFANGLGGAIYFGVIEKTFAVIGLPDVQRIAEKISELVKTSIEPAAQISLEPIRIDDKDIIRLYIPSGRHTMSLY